MNAADLAFVLGRPEIVVLLLLLAIPVGIAVLVLVIVKVTRRPAPPQVMVPPTTPEQRLRELDALKAQNLLTEEEYQAKRKEIIGDV